MHTHAHLPDIVAGKLQEMRYQMPDIDLIPAGTHQHQAILEVDL
jgi:hypothetical protein